MEEGFNWFLIIVAFVVVALVLFGSGYVIVTLQHPEDRNQAWLPKGVTWCGLSLATLSVLMFPLDVANRAACDEDVPLSSCRLTMPMRELWFAMYITIVVLVFLMTPFAIFYYEAGSERDVGHRFCIAVAWVMATGLVIGMIAGVGFALFGYVEYPTAKLTSGSIPIRGFWEMKTLDHCLAPHAIKTAGIFDGDDTCDGKSENVEEEIWRIKTTFPLYIVALASVTGWATFMVFGGVGLSALPVDLIVAFFKRPAATITRTEYVQQARFLTHHAREIKSLGEELKKEERESGRNRRWRRNFKELNNQLLLLEDMNHDLESKYPQGEDGETRWILFQLSFYVKLLLGLLGTVISAMWVTHIILYQLITPPASAFLNKVFIELDGVFPLFGTASFAFFCFYLLACAMKGHVKLGMRFWFLDLYPVRVGATFMNSLLFNTALILLSSTAVLQFCSEAFAVYAKNTDIQEIFGNDIDHLMGIKHIYRKEVFLYCFLGSTAFGIVALIIGGVRKTKRNSRETYIYISQ